jgi:opacity protein-like surface antigen
MKPIMILLLLTVPAIGEIFSLGLKGGVPLTDPFREGSTPSLSYFSDTKRYLLGPAMEVRFPVVGLEFNALYRRLNYRSEDIGSDFVATSTTANSWEFPLLLKVRAPSPGARPFFTTGPTFRHLSGLKQVTTSVIGGEFEALRPSELQNRFNAGFTIGAGVEIGDGVRLVPEIRYIRWGKTNFERPGLLRSNPNQLDFLLGLHF